jgi:hypothetical protein
LYLGLLGVVEFGLSPKWSRLPFTIFVEIVSFYVGRAAA